MNAPILFDREVLLCPNCGDDYTHVDDIQIGARPDGEDGRWQHIQVDSVGHIREDLPSDQVIWPDHGEMRRHQFTLIGSCEQCVPNFAIHFVQHKGATMVYVSSIPGTPTQVDQTEI